MEGKATICKKSFKVNNILDDHNAWYTSLNKMPACHGGRRGTLEEDASRTVDLRLCLALWFTDRLKAVTCLKEIMLYRKLVPTPSRCVIASLGFGKHGIFIMSNPFPLILNPPL